MAKTKDATTSLFSQMPQLNKKDLNPVPSSHEQKTSYAVEEVKEEKKEKAPVPHTQKEKESKPNKRKDIKPVEKSPETLPLRKDGGIDKRFNENKQDKRYQMTLQQDLFDEVNELAFKMSTAKNKISFNSLVIEALEDLVKKYKKIYP